MLLHATESWGWNPKFIKFLLPTASILMLIAWVALSFTSSLPVKLPTLPDLSNLRLSFEPNVGQTEPSVRFLAHASGGMLYFTPSEVALSLGGLGQILGENSAPPLETDPSKRAASPQYVLRLRFQGANPALILEGGQELPGKVNYFFGNDPDKWRTDIPTFGTVNYKGIYPGIDLEYTGQGRQLKGTYTVAPYADPRLISWRYIGAKAASVDESGNLQITVAEAGFEGEAAPITIVEQAPIAWQELNGRQLAVEASYVIAQDGSVTFALGSYDPSHPLTIDPVLSYSTFLGGTGSDAGYGIAVHSSGIYGRYNESCVKTGAWLSFGSDQTTKGEKTNGSQKRRYPT